MVSSWKPSVMQNDHHNTVEAVQGRWAGFRFTEQTVSSTGRQHAIANRLGLIHWSQRSSVQLSWSGWPKEVAKFIHRRKHARFASFCFSHMLCNLETCAHHKSTYCYCSELCLFLPANSQSTDKCRRDESGIEKKIEP